MNKFLKLTILIVVAAGVIILLDYLSGDIPPPPIELVDKTTKEFETKCKQIGAKSWDKTSFETIKLELHSYGQHGVITKEEASKFEAYLYTNYSNSLNTSLEKWLNNDCQSEIKDLYKEMKTVSRVGEYKLILNNSIEILEKYYAAISLPERVKQHTSSEFTDSIHESIVIDINNLCQNESLKNCSKIQAIKSEQLEIMDMFKKFFNEYNNAYPSALQNPDDDSYTRELKDLCCPSNQKSIINYKFYLDQFNALNLCP